MSEPSLPAVVEASAPPVLQTAPQSTPVAVATLSLQVRVDRLMVRAVPELRYRLMRLGVPGIAGLLSLGTALVFVIVLLIPAHQSIESLTSQLSQSAQSGPVPVAQTLSPHKFAGTLPSRGQVPALLATVLAQAKDAGLVLEQGKYVFTPAAGNHLACYSFEFPIKADYASIRNFINKTLMAIPALGLGKLHIERKNVGDTAVSAEVGFVIYLKGGVK
jgi:hypothetical protein